MSPEEIRTLDGPGLTRLAHALGLAPEGVENLVCRHGGIDFGRLVPGTLTVDYWWKPHANLMQADTVFRGLRARGYTTSCLWLADDRRYGDAWVGTEGRQAWSVKWQVPEDEALALLRCAVLAVASQENA